MLQFTSGAIMMAFVTASLFFARFWSKTGDRLFGIFSLAFFMMAIERATLFQIQISETRTWVYLIRLVAFSLIIIGIIDKNRKGQTERI